MKKFGDPVLHRSSVSGIVKKCALNQNKNTNTIALLEKMLEIVPKFSGPENRGLSLFSLTVNPTLHPLTFMVQNYDAEKLRPGT